jgi:hypothetical protein
MKKSKILQTAITKYLCKSYERREGCSRYLCISLCFVYAKESVKENIRKDITNLIDKEVSVEAYMLMRTGHPSPEQAYNFRINLANQLIAKYKEQEKCNQHSTKLSNLYNKLKVALLNKLSWIQTKVTSFLEAT